MAWKKRSVIDFFVYLLSYVIMLVTIIPGILLVVVGWRGESAYLLTGIALVVFGVVLVRYSDKLRSFMIKRFSDGR